MWCKKKNWNNRYIHYSNQTTLSLSTKTKTKKNKTEELHNCPCFYWVVSFFPIESTLLDLNQTWNMIVKIFPRRWIQILQKGFLCNIYGPLHSPIVIIGFSKRPLQHTTTFFSLSIEKVVSYVKYSPALLMGISTALQHIFIISFNFISNKGLFDVLL